MFNVCSNCGQYQIHLLIEPGERSGQAYAICPLCGHKQFFLQLPLLLVSGASGAGKSTVHNSLIHRLPEAVLLDADILWSAAFNHPEDNYRDFCETWLSMCAHISQSGRPVVLFGAGTGVPSNMEPCIFRRYFSSLHYLALTCDDEVLTERLHQRPAWRACGDEFIQRQLTFNQWFKTATSREPPIILLDTAGIHLETTALQVLARIHNYIPPLSPLP